MFSGRGYNIESLAVAEIDQTKNISRITIVTTGTPQVIDQIKLQLKKLVPVHKVADFKREDKKVIFKEMALLKIIGDKKKIEKRIEKVAGYQVKSTQEKASKNKKKVLCFFFPNFPFSADAKRPYFKAP